MIRLTTSLWLATDAMRTKVRIFRVIDPVTDEVVELFHPRRQAWGDHFEETEGVIKGLTPQGIATVQLLNMNAKRRVQLRLIARTME